MSQEPGLDRAAGLIRDVPDFPSQGILFRDITPLLADAAAFRAVVDAIAARVAGADLIAGVEARGFLLGAAVAHAAGVGIVPVRKAGKLPRVAASRTYQLEYGRQTLELPADAVSAGARVYLVDDVLATGGTLAASRDLLEHVGASVIGMGVLLELTALNGAAAIGGVTVDVLFRV